MLETIQRSTSDGLAYEKHGDGVPVVFLHGLTFDRTDVAADHRATRDRRMQHRV